MALNKLIISTILFSLVSNVCLADCDWKTGIQPLPNGDYSYNLDCHLKVSQLVEDNATKDQQIKDLNSAVQLKDLALTASDQRATNWSVTSQALEDRLQKVDTLQSKNEFLFFGLGIATAIATGFAISKLVR